MKELTTPLARFTLTRTADADGVYRCDALPVLTALLLEKPDYVRNRVYYNGGKQGLPAPDDPDFYLNNGELRATWQGVLRLLSRCFQGRRRYEAIEILLDAFTERERATT